LRDSIDPAEVMTKHLQPAHSKVVKELTAALATVAEHHTSGMSVLLASQKVRAAEASIDGLLERYTTIRTARVDLDIFRAYAPEMDVDGEFSEIRNPNDVWQRSGHRNFNAGTPPWPLTPTRARVTWFLTRAASVSVAWRRTSAWSAATCSARRASSIPAQSGTGVPACTAVTVSATTRSRTS